MDVKEFIALSIKEISEGIVEAQKQCEELDVMVNPKLTISGSNGDYYIPVKSDAKYVVDRRVTNVEIDILVSSINEDSENGGFKLGVSFFGTNIGANSLTSNSISNRLKFTIPVALPTTEVK